MYKLTFFVPDNYLEIVKDSLFKAGAGKIGDYSECCWQIKGQGQFRPLSGSNPHIGKLHELEYIEEWRVEMIVADEYIKNVINALKKSHPFETPAYDVLQVVNI